MHGDMDAELYRRDITSTMGKVKDKNTKLTVSQALTRKSLQDVHFPVHHSKRHWEDGQWL